MQTKYNIAQGITARRVAEYGGIGIFVNDVFDDVVYLRTMDIVGYMGVCPETMNSAIYDEVTPLFYNGVYFTAITVRRMTLLGGVIGWIGAFCNQIAAHAISNCADSECEDSDGNDGNDNNDNSNVSSSDNDSGDTSNDSTDTSNSDNYDTKYGDGPGVLVIHASRRLEWPMRVYVYVSHRDAEHRQRQKQKLLTLGYTFHSVKRFPTDTYDNAQVIENQVYVDINLGNAHGGCFDHEGFHISMFSVAEKINDLVLKLQDVSDAKSIISKIGV